MQTYIPGTFCTWTRKLTRKKVILRMRRRHIDCAMDGVQGRATTRALSTQWHNKIEDVPVELVRDEKKSGFTTHMFLQ